MIHVMDIFTLMNIPLNDDQMVTYPAVSRLDSLNAALRSLASVRPDSVSRKEVITLQTGAMQNFPSQCEQFLDLCYRVEEGVCTYPLRLVSRKDLDDNDADWCINYGDVEELAADDRFPDIFWVHPVPFDDSQKIMIGFAEQAPVLTTDSEWPLSQKFIQPCIEYALYWLFSRDSTVVANANRATGHLQTFFSLLGQDTQTAAIISPVTPDYKQV